MRGVEKALQVAQVLLATLFSVWYTFLKPHNPFTLILSVFWGFILYTNVRTLIKFWRMPR